jgi:predicted nucleic acid-binding protein
LRRERVATDESLNRWSLGPGETAVLSFAKLNAGFVAVLDDLAARRCAQACGIQTRGTVGITLFAKSRGIISSARPILEDLRAAGLYLSPELIAYALTLAGEAD